MPKPQTKERILEDMTAVFRSELDDDDLVLSPETTAADVEGWDSLTHLQLVAAVEKRFVVRFAAKEILEFKNVGEMCASVAAKLRG